MKKKNGSESVATLTQSQPAFTYLKLTIETLEQGVMFEINNKDIRTTPMMSFWCVYC